MGKKIVLLIFLGFFGFIFLLKDVLIAKGIETYLTRKQLSKDLSFESIVREKNTLFIREVGLETPYGEVLVEEMEIKCHLSLIPLRFKPDIKMPKVFFDLQKKETELSEDSFSFLFSSLLDFKVVIEEGVLKTPFHSAFVFGFQTAPQKSEKGTFWIKESKEKEPFFVTSFEIDGKNILSTSEIKQGKIEDVLSFASFFEGTFLQDLEEAKGLLSLKSNFCFHLEKGILDLEGQISVNQAAFSSPSLGLLFKTEALFGSFNFHPEQFSQNLEPFWKKGELFLTFEESDLSFQKKEEIVGIHNALGEIRLHPEEDPYLKVEGKILSGQKEIPFEVEGKGELLEDLSYWAQIRASFFQKEESSLSLSLCQTPEKEQVLEIECSFISEEIFRLFQPLLSLADIPECFIEEGSFSGKVLGSLGKQGFKKIEVSDLRSTGIKLFLPTLEVAFQTKGFSLEGSILQKENSLHVRSLFADFEKMDLFYGKNHFTSLSGHLEVEEGILKPSHLEGIYQDFFVALDSLNEDLFTLSCKGSLSKMAAVFLKEEEHFVNPETLFSLSLEISPFEDKTVAKGFFSALSKSKEEIDLSFTLDKKISKKLEDLLSDWNISTLAGSFHSQPLSSQTWARNPDLKATGSVEGSFNRKKIQMQWQDVRGNYVSNRWSLAGEIGVVEPISLSYDVSSGSWKGFFPLDQLFLKDEKSGIALQTGRAKFFLEKDRFSADSLSVVTKGLTLNVDLSVGPKEIHLISRSSEGTLDSLKQFAAFYAPNINLDPLQGDFAIQDRSCSLDAFYTEKGWDLQWQGSLNFSNIATDFGKLGKVEAGKCRLKMDSKGGLLLSQIGGTYFYNQVPASFKISDLDASNGRAFDFSLIAKDEKREWIRLSGKAAKEKDQFLFSFAPLSHIFGLSVSLAPIKMDATQSLSNFACTSFLKLEQIPSYLTMWKEMGLISKEIDPSAFGQAKGTVQVKSSYNFCSNDLQMVFKAENLIYKDLFWGEGSGKISVLNGKAKLEACKVGPYAVKAICDITPSEWKLETCSIDSLEKQLLFKGNYFPDSSKIGISSFAFSQKLGEKIKVRAQGSFEGKIMSKEAIPLQGRGKCTLSSDVEEIYLTSHREHPFLIDPKGFQIEKGEWNLLTSISKQKLGKLSVGKICYLPKEEKLQVTGSELTLPKDSELWKKLSFISKSADQFLSSQAIDLTADIEITPLQKKLTGQLKNGKYQVGALALEIKEISCLQEKETLYVSCQSSLQGEPFLLQSKFDAEKNPTCQLLIRESREKKGIAVLLQKAANGEWFCEKAEGECKGIDLHLVHKKKESDKRLYDLLVNIDFAQANSLFSAKWQEEMKTWKLGSGYALKGKVALDSSSFKMLSFSGEVLANQFECLDKTFDLLKAKVDFTDKKGRIQDLKLEDESANISIKTLDFSLHPDTDLWMVTTPLIQVKNLCPALFLKGKKEKGVEIQNLLVHDVSGNISSLDSFQGKGSLYFSALEKKESSFWDLPLSVIKDWGLDPGLLTPVIGEADFILTRGRFYFTLLRNVYSEGKRSQFFLANPGKEAYLALDGTWHLDLAMKQNVVWKVTEDLILSIRGTIEKPKYSFKKSD